MSIRPSDSVPYRLIMLVNNKAFATEFPLFGDQAALLTAQLREVSQTCGVDDTQPLRLTPVSGHSLQIPRQFTALMESLIEGVRIHPPTGYRSEQSKVVTGPFVIEAARLDAASPLAPKSDPLHCVGISFCWATADPLDPSDRLFDAVVSVPTLKRKAAVEWMGTALEWIEGHNLAMDGEIWDHPDRPPTVTSIQAGLDQLAEQIEAHDAAFGALALALRTQIPMAVSQTRAIAAGASPASAHRPRVRT